MAFLLDTITPLQAAYVSVLMVVFLILAFVCQRKTWMWLGMVATFATGLGYLAAPDLLLKFQVTVCV